MRKRTLAVILVMFVLFALCSCGQMRGTEDGAAGSQAHIDSVLNSGLPELDERATAEDNMKTGLYELSFSAPKVAQIAVGNGRIDVNLQTEKTVIETKDDALAYGEKLYSQLEEVNSRCSNLKPFAILRDAGNDAWGVAFGSEGSGVGGGISMAFSAEGSVIAIWEGE